jgi:hypothetical protein
MPGPVVFADANFLLYVQDERDPAKRARASRYLVWNPRAIDEEVLKTARQVEHRYRISWWDSMIVAAAQLQDCALLLTEDLQDGMVFDAVTVRSPFTLEIREPAALYAARPMVASLHRPRGRPRRTAESPEIV